MRFPWVLVKYWIIFLKIRTCFEVFQDKHNTYVRTYLKRVWLSALHFNRRQHHARGRDHAWGRTCIFVNVWSSHLWSQVMQTIRCTKNSLVVLHDDALEQWQLCLPRQYILVLLSFEQFFGSGVTGKRCMSTAQSIGPWTVCRFFYLGRNQTTAASFVLCNLLVSVCYLLTHFTVLAFLLRSQASAMCRIFLCPLQCLGRSQTTASSFVLFNVCYLLTHFTDRAERSKASAPCDMTATALRAHLSQVYTHLNKPQRMTWAKMDLCGDNMIRSICVHASYKGRDEATTTQNRPGMLTYVRTSFLLSSSVIL